MGAMKNTGEKFRLSIYEHEQVLLRQWLIDKRKAANLTQRELALRLGVVHSLVGKVEQGERRLEVVEFIKYCKGLGAEPTELIQLFQTYLHSKQPL
ncbi:MAG TPA: helix-turn-helix transcriptional regulator [Candidatus Rifleibacterium sp.]|nr:helix-turn-helix transcriptional regulator [Candidatus Rifleibacterium sp.]HPT45817.1 helix-turn-helix transcriptional regulator [Candidatus Rifleibacterium sp.]